MIRKLMAALVVALMVGSPGCVSEQPAPPPPSDGERVSHSVANRVINRNERVTDMERQAGEALARTIQSSGSELNGLDGALMYSSQVGDVVGVYTGQRRMRRDQVNRAERQPGETRTPRAEGDEAPPAGD